MEKIFYVIHYMGVIGLGCFIGGIFELGIDIAMVSGIILTIAVSILSKFIVYKILKDKKEIAEIMSDFETGLQNCKTKKEIEKYLDGREMSYSISDNPRDLIEDYAASDAFSEEDVEWLLSTDEKTLIEQFKMKPDARYMFINGYHLLVYEQ